MNTQEAFDIMIAHLRKQRKKSIIVDEEGDIICMYRNPWGLKCAVGVLIPDEMYNPDMEGKSVSHLISKFPHMFAGIQEDLLECIQRIHDRYPVDSWEKRFKELAKMFNLTYDREYGIISVLFCSEFRRQHNV